jgi:hypothetical protein
MNPNTQFERDLELWLRAVAPANAPAGLHGAVIDRARTMRQRSGWMTLPSRRFGRGRGLTLLAAGALLLGGGALGVGSGLVRPPKVVQPAPSPSATAVPSTSPWTMTSMWPQSTLEEVQAAQQLADAGDPRYTWQIGPDLEAHLGQGGPYREQIFARFLQEKLGWEEFRWTLGNGIGNGILEYEGRVVFLRCSVGACDPTIDESRYETVQINVAQLARQGESGIWVVTGWEMLEPFQRIVPPPLDASVTALLNGFLDARVAGAGAQPYLDDPEADIPLLYATSSGARYEWAEFQQLPNYDWPYGLTAIQVLLHAGDTDVYQLFFMSDEDGSPGLGYVPDGYGTEIAPTIEDGWIVPAPYDAFDGEVTLQVSHPWVSRYGTGAIRLIPEDPGVAPTTDGGERNAWHSLVVMADPTRIGTGCPTVSGRATAEELAQSIRSDPGLQATAPVSVGTRGAAGLAMDVAIAAGVTGDSGCRGISGRTGGMPGLGGSVSVSAGARMRLYLFDAPEGSSMRTLAIAVVVPESEFERAASALDSVEFHAP